MTRHLSRYRIFETPAGPYALIARGDGGIAATWIELDGDESRPGRNDQRLLPELSERLRRYFKGEDVDFDDVPTPPGPDFHRRCWQACRSIRFGGTSTYGELAGRAGSGAAAARAAGQAMRRNPLPVIVPCHRVVGSGGRLHGYGGVVDPASPHLAVKRVLLALEGALSRETARTAHP